VLREAEPDTVCVEHGAGCRWHRGNYSEDEYRGERDAWLLSCEEYQDLDSRDVEIAARAEVKDEAHEKRWATLLAPEAITAYKVQANWKPWLWRHSTENALMRRKKAKAKLVGWWECPDLDADRRSRCRKGRV
jgi:hypothetical protein